jgi:acyl-homoserine lactone acylase PvdQ
LKEYINTIKEWRSIPANILSADSSGNIGYFLASPSLAINNSSPYLSSSMLDGSISDNDALGIVPTETLPFSINPSKGYFAAANNRVMPENSKYDVGTSGTITTRATRINEILRTGIQDGRKFSKQDMIDI